MKKKTLTALALGAATVATGMASNVHADSVTVTKQQVGDETKITTTTTTTKEADQQKVAQDKQAISSQQKVVDSAKSSLDSAKANASSTSQAVSSAQSNVNNAKKTLDEVKAKQPSQVKQQVAQDQSQVAQDKQNISVTQSSIRTDKNNINKDQQAINNVGQKAQQDQQKLNDDQGKLSDAQNTLNNDQGKLNDVNKQLSELQNQNQNYPEIYVTQSGKVYLQAVSQDKSYLDGPSKADIWDETPMSNYLKEHSLDGDASWDAMSPIQEGVSVKFPNSTMGQTQSGLTSDPVSGQKLLDYQSIKDWVDGHNGGYYSKADDYQIDPTNLTSSQMKEINIFATELINEFRTEIGLKPLKLTQTIVDAAGKVAQRYNEDNYNKVANIGSGASDNSQYQAHDEDAFIDAGFSTEGMCPDRLSQKTLKDDDDDISFLNPNASHLATHFTMNNLKTVVADSIQDLLQNPDGHAQSIMDPNCVAAGVSVDKFGDVLVDYLDVKPTDMSIEKQEEFDKQFGTDLDHDPSLKNRISLRDEPNLVATNNSASQIAKLQSQVSQLQSKVNADKQTVSDLTNKVNSDKAQLQKDTPAGLQKQLQNDQAKLANDQATLKQQQAELAKDEAQLKANQDKLNSITPAEVAQAQQQLEEAQANYNNSVKALNDAQSKANASNDEVAKAQQNYLDALNKLNELKQVLENDEKETTTTSVQWVKNEHPTTTASMGNKVVLSSSKNTPEAPQKASTSATTSAVSSSKKQSAYLTTTVTPVKSSSVEENNTVHADTVKAVKAAQGSKVEAENTIHFTSEAPQSSVKKEAKQNTMPQMGDENSNATVWGEISLAMAGVLATLGLAKRRRHE